MQFVTQNVGDVVKPPPSVEKTRGGVEKRLNLVGQGDGRTITNAVTIINPGYNKTVDKLDSY